MITIEQFENGLLRYVENEIAMKSTGVRKFGVYFLMPTIKNRADNLIKKNHDWICDYMDQNNNIDIDRVYNSCKDAIHHSGQFEFMGLVFKEDDIDSVYRYIIS